MILVGAIVLVDTMFFAAITPLLPQYSEDLGLSKAAAGVLSASYAVGGLLGSFPAGYAAARFGVRPVLLIGLALLGGSSIVFGVAQNVVLLDVARFIQGVGGGCLWAAGLAWLTVVAPRERRAELLGTAIGAAIFGALLGPVLGSLASVAGTAVTFSSVAGVAAVLAWVVWSMPAPPRGGEHDPRILLRAFRDRLILSGAWIITVPSLAYGALGVIGSLRLDEFGASAIAIGAVWLIAASLETIVAPLTGRFADRRGVLAVTRLGLIGAFFLTLLIPLPSSAWLLGLVIIIASPLYGALWVPGMALLSEGAESVGMDHSFAFAIFNVAWAGAQIAGSAGGASLAQATGSDAAPFLVIAAFALGTLVVMGRRRRDVAAAA